jgi:tetratricopeptide (TPR) repeat protein
MPSAWCVRKALRLLWCITSFSASHQYRRAETLGLHNGDLFVNLGFAYAERSDSANALAALEQAVSLAPERVETHFNLALLYEQESRRNEALKEITIARRLDPQGLDVQKTNSIVRAESAIDCADRTAPEYDPAQINLASPTPNAGPFDLQWHSHVLQVVGISRADLSDNTRARTWSKLMPLQADTICYDTAR